MNTDFWNGLPDEHEAIIQAAATTAEDDVRNRVSEIEATAYAAAEENGMTVYKPTAEEISAWKAVSQPVYDAYNEKAGDLGKQVMDAANKL